MLASILPRVWRSGAIYALIGITYNTMFSASRVMSFTAGQLGMLGGVLGSLFILQLGLPPIVGFVADAGRLRRGRRRHRNRRGAAGAEKPRPASLCALDAGARADDPAGRGDRMEHRAAALPARCSGSATAIRSTRSSGCRSSPARSPSSGSNISIAARWSAAPSWRSPRTISPRARSACPSAICASASYALAGVIGGIAGFCRRRVAAGVLRQRRAVEFLRLRAGGARRPRQQPWRHHRRARARPVPAGCEFPGRRHLLLGGGVHAVHRRSARGARKACSARPRRGGCDDRSHRSSRQRSEPHAYRALLPQLAPFLGILAVAMVLPFVSNDYWALIGTRAAIYWVLVSGLNLVVGFAGHLAIGYVALLTLGAYTTSVLVAGNVMPPVPVFAALPIAALRRRGVRRHRRPAGPAIAHVLFRDVDAWLRHHRHADCAGLAERHRRRHRHCRSGISSAVRYRMGLLLSLRRHSQPSAPG